MKVLIPVLLGLSAVVWLSFDLGVKYAAKFKAFGPPCDSISSYTDGDEPYPPVIDSATELRIRPRGQGAFIVGDSLALRRYTATRTGHGTGQSVKRKTGTSTDPRPGDTPQFLNTYYFDNTLTEKLDTGGADYFAPTGKYEILEYYPLMVHRDFKEVAYINSEGKMIVIDSLGTIISMIESAYLGLRYLPDSGKWKTPPQWIIRPPKISSDTTR